MSERQPNRPPIPEPKKASHEGDNGAPGIPPSINELPNPPPDDAVKKPRLTPEGRREQHRKYMKDYRKRNRDKVNDYQRRYRSDAPVIRPNEKLVEHQVSGHKDRSEKSVGIAVLAYLFVLRVCHDEIVPGKPWSILQLQHTLRLQVMTNQVEHKVKVKMGKTRKVA